MRHPLLAAAAVALTLSGCALFQQVPGRVTNGTVTSEAGGVWGKTTMVQGNCPSIEFMGAQNVGEVAATCSGNGAQQSITAKSIDANSVLATAIQGQTALGNNMASVAQALIGLLGAAKAGATGGLGAGGPIGAPGYPVGSAPMLVCPVGTIITMQGDRPVCL